MWFVFPQIAGLGRSATSQAYAISDLAEAKAYLAHPVLGPRLIECAEIVASHHGLTAEHIFGGIDAIKLRSSMTLFAHADPDQRIFQQVIDQYYDGPIRRPSVTYNDSLINLMQGPVTVCNVATPGAVV
jgi:uncharacterized protein (DUF1810 family)